MTMLKYQVVRPEQGMWLRVSAKGLFFVVIFVGCCQSRWLWDRVEGRGVVGLHASHE